MQSSVAEEQLEEEEGDGGGEGGRRAGLDPGSFSLVEAAQYGNLER